MALQAADMADLITTTQKNLGRFKFSDAATRLQRYPTFEMLMRKNNASTYPDGYALQWNVKVSRGSPARMTGMYGTDIINQKDTQKTATLPFRHLTHNYAFDEHEIAMNSAEARILQLVKVRRYDCWVEVAEKVETQMWANPNASATDDINGIPYHIVKGSTDGFTGGHASGFSDWCGLSRTAYTGLKNYSATYVNVTPEDFVSKLSDALDLTNFKAPVEAPMYGTKSNYAYYCGLQTRKGLKQILERQNDSLGEDVDSMNGRVRVRKTPVDYVSLLDSDTDRPFYGINWDTFKVAVLVPFFLRESKPEKVSLQHTVFVVFVDLSLNTECYSPRDNFVLTKGTSGQAQ